MLNNIQEFCHFALLLSAETHQDIMILHYKQHTCRTIALLNNKLLRVVCFRCCCGLLGENVPLIQNHQPTDEPYVRPSGNSPQTFDQLP